MTPETNRCIEYAKRRSVDMIWRSANIETPGLTFPDTCDIINDALDSGRSIRSRDILVVNQLKHAWAYLFEHVTLLPDVRMLCEYNRLVGEVTEHDPGLLRTHPVRITGTDWMPPAHISAQMAETALAGALANPDPTERALHLFADICRNQWFRNGNKRTASMAANHLLISSGAGVFAMPPSVSEGAFRPALISYYETGDLPAFSAWLARHAVGTPDRDGLTVAQEAGEDPLV